MVPLLAVFFAALQVPASPGPAMGQGLQDPRGIYVYSWDMAVNNTPATAPALMQALGVPGTDGVTLVQSWNQIEPVMGHYEWEFQDPCPLDQWMGAAIQSGKKVLLAIRCGKACPRWLYQPTSAGGAGAAPLTFEVTPHQGINNVPCEQVVMAAPWDPVFLQQWDAMLSAVAAHLKGVTVTVGDTAVTEYDAVTQVRLTGINRTTDEFRLPAEVLTTPCVANAICTWLEAGFRPSKLLSAWDAVTTSFATYFPDKAFNVPIIPSDLGQGQYPFPPIDEAGNVINGVDCSGTVYSNTVPDQNLALIQMASQKFPGRLVVEFESLELGQHANTWVCQYAASLGTQAAFQTNNFFGQQGGGCSCTGSYVNPVACTSATYFGVLQAGIYPNLPADPLRAQFIEVMPPDAIAFPDAIWQAHLELTRPAPAGPPGSLAFAPGSTERVAQLIGDSDVWTRSWPPVVPASATLSLTARDYGVSGCNLGGSFEDGTRLVLLFGDAVDYGWNDPVAWTRSADPLSLQLTFFTATNSSPLFKEQPLKTGPAKGRYTVLLDPAGPKAPRGGMGAGDVPYSGIALGTRAYATFRMGHTPGGYTTDRSVLARLNTGTGKSTVLRTLSSLPGGRFIQTSLQESFLELNDQLPLGMDYVVEWGTGVYGASDAYLAVTPASSFGSGSGTLYFSGLDQGGHRTWTTDESGAVPVVSDGTMGDLSVAWVQAAGLWVMLAGTQVPDAGGRVGVAMRYAQEPWGPWSAPQVIYSDPEGYYHYLHTPPCMDNDGDCNYDDGLDSPAADGCDPTATGGHAFAPMIIGRFSTLSGNTLTLYYSLSTTLPDSVVLMRSDFTVSP